MNSNSSNGSEAVAPSSAASEKRKAQVELGCPFQDDRPHDVMVAGVHGTAWVECLQCGARGPLGKFPYGRDAAIAGWNRRTHWYRNGAALAEQTQAPAKAGEANPNQGGGESQHAALRESDLLP